MDKIVNDIYNIFLKENRFLTLPELYNIYKKHMTHLSILIIQLL